MRTYRVMGGLAALVLLAAVLVPVLIDRAERAASHDPDGRGEPTTTMVSVLRLPTAAPPRRRSPTKPASTPAPYPTQSKLGRRALGTLGEITFPPNAPPLPNRDVPPGVLAYSVGCAGSTKPCWSWRLLDWKGRHWTLPKATAVSVSPNGRRIAYVQPDGRFVVRDLAAGTVDQPVQVPPRALASIDPHVIWSPNSRWLTIDYQTSHADQRPAVLVDTTTMRTRTLDIACCVAGLHPTGEWLLDYDLYGRHPGVFERVDAFTGRTARTIDPKELYEQRWARGRTAYSLSPDGRQFAIFLWDRKAGTHGLGLVDADTGKVTGQHSLDVEGIAWGELIGWPDVRTIAVGTESNGQVLTYDLQTRKLRAAYTFSDPPDRLSLAIALVRAQ